MNQGADVDAVPPERIVSSVMSPSITPAVTFAMRDGEAPWRRAIGTPVRRAAEPRSTGIPLQNSHR
jgi:hypothetical protein